MKLKPRSAAIGFLATGHTAVLLGEVSWRSFIAAGLLLGLIMLTAYDLKKDGLI